jgi:acyl carrier protein
VNSSARRAEGHSVARRQTNAHLFTSKLLITEELGGPMDQALAAKVIAGIAAVKKIPIESITADSTFEQLQMDSLDAMNLLFVLEDELDVSIPDEAAYSIRDVRSAVAGVERVLAEKSAAAAANVAGSGSDV